MEYRSCHVTEYYNPLHITRYSPVLHPTYLVQLLGSKSEYRERIVYCISSHGMAINGHDNS